MIERERTAVWVAASRTQDDYTKAHHFCSDTSFANRDTSVPVCSSCVQRFDTVRFSWADYGILVSFVGHYRRLGNLGCLGPIRPYWASARSIRAQGSQVVGSGCCECRCDVPFFNSHEGQIKSSFEPGRAGRLCAYADISTSDRIQKFYCGYFPSFAV